MKSLCLFILSLVFLVSHILGCDNGNFTTDNCGDGVVDIGEECDNYNLDSKF